MQWKQSRKVKRCLPPPQTEIVIVSAFTCEVVLHLNCIGPSLNINTERYSDTLKHEHREQTSRKDE